MIYYPKSNEYWLSLEDSKQALSFHTINEKGTEAKDTFMTIIETAKKVAVNSYQYLRDRMSQKFEMPSLVSLIQNKSQVLIQ